MIQETAEVLWNERLGDQYFRIGLTGSSEYRQAVPGQFVMVRVSDDGDPLLRRPFSIHRQIIEGKELKGIELLYKVVGKGTDMLAGSKKGARLDLLGPLGRGFQISDTYERIYLVAGGIGVAPLMFLASCLKRTFGTLSKCRLFLGGKTQKDLLCENEFAELGLDISISTDDGSAGKSGLVTQSLEMALKNEMPDLICACGPEGMLARIQDIGNVYSIPCQISIETLMACGIGACLGCAVDASGTDQSYLHACKDGPVFDAAAIHLKIP